MDSFPYPTLTDDDIDEIGEMLRQLTSRAPRVVQNGQNPGAPPPTTSGECSHQDQEQLFELSQLKDDLIASRLYNIELITTNKTLATELEQAKKDLAAKDEALNEHLHMMVPVAPNVLQLEEITKAQQHEIERLQKEVDSLKNEKDESQRRLNRAKQSLQQFPSSVGNPLRGPTLPSVSEQPAPENSSNEGPPNLRDFKDEQEKLKQGLSLMTANLQKLVSNLGARATNATSSPVPAILPENTSKQVQTPPTSTSSSEQSTSSDAHFSSTSTIVEAGSTPTTDLTISHQHLRINSRSPEIRKLPKRKCKAKNSKSSKNPEWRKFSCENCQAKFCSFSHLKLHIIRKHKNVDIRDLIAGCGNCGKTFSSEVECMTHAKKCRKATRGEGKSNSGKRGKRCQ